MPSVPIVGGRLLPTAEARRIRALGGDDRFPRPGVELSRLELASNCARGCWDATRAAARCRYAPAARRSPRTARRACRPSRRARIPLSRGCGGDRCARSKFSPPWSPFRSVAVTRAAMQRLVNVADEVQRPRDADRALAAGVVRLARSFLKWSSRSRRFSRCRWRSARSIARPWSCRQKNRGGATRDVAARPPRESDRPGGRAAKELACADLPSRACPLGTGSEAEWRAPPGASWPPAYSWVQATDRPRR